MKYYILLMLVALSSGHVFADSKSETLEQIEELKLEVARLEAENQTVVQLQQNLQSLKSDGEKKKAEIIELEKGISDLNYLYGIYKSSYRIIPRVANGTPLGNISLRNGTVIQNAMFSGAAKGGIQVVGVGAGGLITVPVDEIPTGHSDKFNLPQNVPMLSKSLNEVASTRPSDVLGPLPNAKLAVANKPSNQLKPQAPAGNAGNTMKPASPSVASPSQDDTAAKLARNEARWEKIDILKQESKNLNAKKKGLRAQRRSQERSFQTQRIKPDKNKVQSVLGAFDVQIQALEEREREISAEISKIRKAIE